MGYSVRGTVRVRVLNTVAVDLNAAYGEFMCTGDPQMQNVDLNTQLGSRRVGTKYHPSWRISFPWHSTQLANLQLVFKPGNIVSFEIIRNPEDAAGEQSVEVVVESCVGPRARTPKPADVDPGSITGEGGDWYPEQLGRAGLPSPFSSAP
jgi:hypothetical protein